MIFAAGALEKLDVLTNRTVWVKSQWTGKVPGQNQREPFFE
jgi:hypothetical protein